MFAALYCVLPAYYYNDTIFQAADVDEGDLSAAVLGSADVFQARSLANSPANSPTDNTSPKHGTTMGRASMDSLDDAMNQDFFRT